MSLIAFTLTIVMLASAPANAAPGNTSELINRQDQTCLAVGNNPYGPFFSGQQVHVASCGPTAYTTWHVRVLRVFADGTPLVALSPPGRPDLCLDVPYGSHVHGVNLQIAPCTTNDAAFTNTAQEFRALQIAPGPGGGLPPWTLLINQESGMCVDKSGGTVVQWECWSPWWQEWMIW